MEATTSFEPRLVDSKLATLARWCEGTRSTVPVSTDRLAIACVRYCIIKQLKPGTFRSAFAFWLGWLVLDYWFGLGWLVFKSMGAVALGQWLQQVSDINIIPMCGESIINRTGVIGMRSNIAPSDFADSLADTNVPCEGNLRIFIFFGRFEISGCVNVQVVYWNLELIDSCGWGVSLVRRGDERQLFSSAGNRHPPRSDCAPSPMSYRGRPTAASVFQAFWSFRPYVGRRRAGTPSWRSTWALTSAMTMAWLSKKSLRNAGVLLWGQISAHGHLESLEERPFIIVFRLIVCAESQASERIKTDILKQRQSGI
eukprot:s2122_g8.t1